MYINQPKYMTGGVMQNNNEVRVQNSDHDNRHRVFVGGVDMCFVNPQIMEIQSCMATRYDAGIVKHQREHTGVIEVWKIK